MTEKRMRIDRVEGVQTIASFEFIISCGWNGMVVYMSTIGGLEINDERPLFERQSHQNNGKMDAAHLTVPLRLPRSSFSFIYRS